jgi:hypothetical protein
MSQVQEIIDPEFAKRFAGEAKANGFPHVEEKTLHVSRAWAVGDIASGAGQQADFEVFTGTSGNLVERTQNPSLSNTANLPPEVRVAMCAVAVVVRLGNLGTILQAQSMQPDLDRSVLTLKIGGVEHLQLDAPEFMDYGPPLLLGNDTTAGNTGRFTNGPRTFRKLALPRLPGVQQQLSLLHSVARTSAWGVAFTADYLFPSLIARRTV